VILDEAYRLIGRGLGVGELESWAGVNFNNASPVQAGSKSMSVATTNYGPLFLHTPCGPKLNEPDCVGSVLDEYGVGGTIDCAGGDYECGGEVL